MPDTRPKALQALDRTTGSYVSNQYLAVADAKWHQDHKNRMRDNDRLASGDLRGLFPKEELPEVPLVENKYKNAVHDLARLATEAKPVPVFPTRGEGQREFEKARIREQAAETIWCYGGGEELARKLYIDLMHGGFMAVAAYYNKQSEYTQFMRLDPRYCYPAIRNGRVTSVLYVEVMPAEEAALQWPEVPIATAKSETHKDVTVVVYYDNKTVSTVVVQHRPGGRTVSNAFVVSNWVHKLDCVPVAFVPLDSIDSELRGMFDQLGGPLMIRNKVISFLDQYMQDMVHASFEAKGIMNPDDEPGPLTIYQHDPNFEGETFMRRVAPAAPAGSVFGVLNYLDAQESTEALQPPARVGQVSQSIASGSFVNSTQGGLSSAVRELQDCMANLRKQLHYVAFKIEETWLDKEKPLMRAVGQKKTYTPSKDIAGNYHHRILFGAAAGLDRQYADVRVLQHAGARFISRRTARTQLDYLDDPTSEQDVIDFEQMGDVLFQRFVANPQTPDSELAEAMAMMGEGKSLAETMAAMAPKIAEREKAALAAQAEQAGAVTAPEGAAPEEPGEEALALEKGATEEAGPEFEDIRLGTPPPLSQLFVSAGRR